MTERCSKPSSGSSSPRTSPSLLAGVRIVEPAAWDRFVSLYGPLVYHWCRSASLQDHDVEDVFQEVFQAVLVHIGEFRKEREGDTLRGWLFTITRNKIRDHFRRAGREPRGEGGTEALVRFSQIAAPGRDEPPSRGEQDPETGAERALFRRALELIRGEFKEPTWQAFWRTVVDGRAAADVAAELGTTPGAVRVAKSRVLRRLRQEINGAGVTPGPGGA
jgi:RNA polymerase sigma-70 factor (ECF subfamily)